MPAAASRRTRPRGYACRRRPSGGIEKGVRSDFERRSRYSNPPASSLALRTRGTPSGPKTQFNTRPRPPKGMRMRTRSTSISPPVSCLLALLIDASGSDPSHISPRICLPAASIRRNRERSQERFREAFALFKSPCFLTRASHLVYSLWAEGPVQYPSPPSKGNANENAKHLDFAPVSCLLALLIDASGSVPSHTSPRICLPAASIRRNRERSQERF